MRGIFKYIFFFVFMLTAAVSVGGSDYPEATGRKVVGSLFAIEKIIIMSKKSTVNVK